MNTQSPRKWTTDVIVRLKQLIADKRSAQDCSRELNLTVSAIRTKAHELHLKFLSKRTKTNGSFNSTWSDQDIETLRSKFSENWTAVVIGQYLNRSTSNVYSKLRELKLHSPRSNMTIETLEAKRRGLSICRNCQCTKPISEFNRRGKLGTGYLKSVCKECERILGKEKYQSKDYYTLEETIQERVRQAKYRSRRKHIPFEITYSDVLQVYNTQNGKCFYSGIEMTRIPTRNNWTNISIDRIIPEIGYTKDNIVLCCDSINTMKNSMPLEKFLEICQTIVSYQKR